MELLTRPPIVRVFAEKLESYDSAQFKFWGILQTDTRYADQLSTNWMDINHMGIEFRKNLKREPGKLFKIPADSKYQTTRLHLKCGHQFGDSSDPMTILAHSAVNALPRSRTVESPSKTSRDKRPRSLEQPPHPCSRPAAPFRENNKSRQHVVTDILPSVIKKIRQDTPSGLHTNDPGNMDMDRVSYELIVNTQLHCGKHNEITL